MSVNMVKKETVFFDSIERCRQDSEDGSSDSEDGGFSAHALASSALRFAIETTRTFWQERLTLHNLLVTSLCLFFLFVTSFYFFSVLAFATFLSFCFSLFVFFPFLAFFLLSINSVLSCPSSLLFFCFVDICRFAFFRFFRFCPFFSTFAGPLLSFSTFFYFQFFLFPFLCLFLSLSFPPPNAVCSFKMPFWHLSASAIFVEVVLQSWSWFVWQKRLVMARRVASYMAKVHSTQDDDRI